MVYYHADVFSPHALSGNGLTVVFHEQDMDAGYMQRIAQEFRQFETIFLRLTGEKRFRARIFTTQEELDFAGHPVLGAVSAVHDKLYPHAHSMAAALELNARTVRAVSAQAGGHYEAGMNQGVPAFLGVVDEARRSEFLQALNLSPADLHCTLPMEVVSTGLPYLIVPVSSGLDRAKISVSDFEARLKQVGAKFVYVLDADKREGRTWDNSGAAEDVATGSAAGPAGAYLYKWHICGREESIIVNQGGFAGRPSMMKVSADAVTGEITVAGDVCIVAEGTLRL